MKFGCKIKEKKELKILIFVVVCLPTCDKIRY